MSDLRAGVHYPRSVGEFGARFGSDADCLDYLEWARLERPPGNRLWRAADLR